MIKVRGGGPPQDIEVVATDNSKDDKKRFCAGIHSQVEVTGEGGGEG